MFFDLAARASRTPPPPIEPVESCAPVGPTQAADTPRAPVAAPYGSKRKPAPAAAAASPPELARPPAAIQEGGVRILRKPIHHSQTR